MRRILSRRTMPDTQPIKDYLCVTFPNGGTITLNGTNDVTMGNIMFSTNGRDWQSVSRVRVSDNGKVYIKGEGKGDSPAMYYTDKIRKYFSTAEANQKAILSGNIMSVLYGDNFENVNSVGANAFRQMFTGCRFSDISQVKLPATEVGEYAYCNLFKTDYQNSTYKKSPKLPATILHAHCYDSMFEFSSLTEMPELPATVLAPYCYQNMFAKSFNLKDLKILPATDLTGAEGCYWGMFSSCTALEHLPHNMLPALILSDYCYKGMFGPWRTEQGAAGNGCISLTSIPSDLLPANTHIVETTVIDENTQEETTIQEEVTSLAVSCYENMFEHSGLTYIPDRLLPATILADYCYKQMFWYCDHLTRLPRHLLHKGMTLANYCYNAMFASCSNLDSIPEGFLPAINLKEGCYCSMFSSCLSLISLPDNLLPSLSVPKRAYSSMFSSCINIIKIPYGFLPATYIGDEAYNYMFRSCSHLTTIATPLIAKNAVLGDTSLSHMFDGCRSLVTINKDMLPTENLGQSCYSWMFKDCYNLRNTVSFGSTTANLCYQGMYEGCKLLTEVEELPATTLAMGCYSSMFNACEALTQAPVIKATVFGNSSCSFMFANCKLLEAPPVLNITRLSQSSLAGMFEYCHAISDISNVQLENVTTLAQDCYCYLFQGCRGITDLTGHYLPAQIRNEDTGAYESMFKDCINLETVPVDFIRSTSFGASGCCQAMFKGCKKLSVAPYINAQSATGSLEEPVAGNGAFREMFMNCYTEVTENGVTTYTGLTHMAHFQNEDVAKLPFTSAASLSFYQMFANCKALIETPILNPKYVGAYAFQYMYQGCSSLQTISEGMFANVLSRYHNSTSSQWADHMFADCTSLENIPSDLISNQTLKDSGYWYMFQNCTNLKVTPKFPNRGDFYCMFDGCDKLWKISELPELGIDMNFTLTFAGCDALIDVPTIKGTDVNCTSMFEGCSNLENVNLDIKILWDGGVCTNMFNGCSNLKKAEGTLTGEMGHNCFKGMFKGCSKLTEAPSFNIKPLREMYLSNSCEEMFAGCSELQTVEGSITISHVGTGIFKNMFQNCTKLNGVPTFIVNGRDTRNQCYYGMFDGCEVLDHMIPGLTENITTLTSQCYAYMYQNCKKLNVTLANGILPAGTAAPYCYLYMFKGSGVNGMANGSMALTTLESNCCEQMFYNCVNLASVYCVATNPSTSYTSDWLNGAGTDVQGEKTFTQKTGVTWPSGVSGIPEGWTVEYVNN